jgi:methionyl-tRNA formyltransferase
MDALIEAITIINDGDYTLIPNSDSEMSYFSFPTKNDVKAFYDAGRRFY